MRRSIGSGWRRTRSVEVEWCAWMLILIPWWKVEVEWLGMVELVE
jgi:hypothetical protein